MGLLGSLASTTHSVTAADAAADATAKTAPPTSILTPAPTPPLPTYSAACSQRWPPLGEAQPTAPKHEKRWWSKPKPEGKLTNAQVSETSKHATSVNLGVKAQSVVAPDMPIADLQPEAHAAAADGARVRLMLDGGANLGIANAPSIIADGEPTGRRGGKVTGVGSTAKVEDQRRVGIGLLGHTSAGANEPIHGDLEMSLITGTKRNIVPESTVVNNWGVSIVKTPQGSYLTTGRVSPPTSATAIVMPIIEESGLYFIDATIGAPFTSASLPPPECRSVNPVDRRASLWAARLHGTSKTLARARRIAKDIPAITSSVKESLRADVALRMANERRSHVAKQTPGDKRATKPGQRLILDGSGPFAEACIVTGSCYELSAIDEKTSRGWVQPTKTHTIDDWIDFLRTVLLEVKKHGHVTLALRFDRAPELRSDKLKKRVEREFGVTVELAPRNHHEGVALAEAFNDRRERMAEAFCRRAGKSIKYMLCARAYAQFIMNCRCKRGSTKSRFESFSGSKLCLDKRPPYLFGTWCVLLNEEQARGPKGGDGRADQGELLGMTEQGAYVVRLKQGGVREQRNVTAVDEWQLLDNGLAARLTTKEVQTQTAETRVPEEEPTPPDEPVAPKAPKPPAHPPRPPDLDVVHQRIEVEWPGLGYFGARVTEHRSNPRDGVQEYHVIYDNKGKRWQPRDVDMWHVLDPTSDKARVWRHEQFAIRPSPLVPRADQRITRATRRALDAAAIERYVPDVLLANASSGTEAMSVCEAALYQNAPHVLDAEMADYECSLALTATHNGVDPTRGEAPAGECHKAKQSHIELETDVGTRVLKVPSNAKQVRASPECENWTEAQRTALNVLLARPGNQLVKRKQVDAPIAKCVTDMKLKIDQATGRLAAQNAFKARHACDYTRGPPLPKLSARPNFAAQADDLTIKMFMSDMAKRNRNATKGDVGNAYLNATRRNTSTGYMDMPELLREYDDEGDELVIELATPCWGEDSAGADWYCEFADTLEQIGWRRDEAVPCMWYFNGTEGDARMITIVDDFLISESFESGYSIADATIAALRSKYGKVSAEHEPSHFVGYKIERDRPRRTLRLSMPQKIEEAINTYFPELADGKGENKLPSHHKDIKAVEKMADALRLNPDAPQPKKLSREAKRNQRAIGAMKFFEKVMPAISLPVHRLSCIMANPDGAEATEVVKSVMRHAYSHRHEGITYGGDHLIEGRQNLAAEMTLNMKLSEGAPLELEAFGDATWGLHDIYGVLITRNGGAVFHQVKRVAIACSCSQHAEAIPTQKASEIIVCAREIERALGAPPTQATLIGTDNKANFLVARDAGSAARSKHFLRTYFSLRERMTRGEVDLKHVNDVNNPADFLTKWLGKSKLEESIDYASNRKAICQPTAP